MTLQKTLNWKFEAFRRYIPYHRMLQAASVLCMYENEKFGTGNPKMQEILKELQLRTGEPWLPEREVSESVEYNAEGDFYRNKGRLLTSFYIIEPKDLVESSAGIKLTQFGKALGMGFITEKEYYEFIVTRMTYPHPAYKDNWAAWKNASRTLKPLIFILQILIELYNKNSSYGYLTSQELATYAYPVSIHSEVPSIVQKILEHRERPGKTVPYSDAVNRKINDMLGFLSIAGYIYYKGSSAWLNLLDVHPQELSYYWEKRKTRGYSEANKLRYFIKLVNDSFE